MNSSFPKVATQVLNNNKNIIEILSNLNKLNTTSEPSTTMSIYDDNGNLTNVTLPSLNYIKSELQRIDNNVKSLYNIDKSGSLVNVNGTFKKVVAVDLNQEPMNISTIGSPITFNSKKNWFFDDLLNPMLSVSFDLSGKIDTNTNNVLVRRYMVEFNKNEDGSYTNNGLSALNRFNELFIGNASISHNEFLEWHKTTPGIIEPLNPNYDETIFNLEPNNLLYDGYFSVLAIDEDRANNKLWYVLDKLTYKNTQTNQPVELSIGDEVILNAIKSSTRYKVVEISVSQAYPRVRFELVEGLESIPVALSSLKIYSPIVYNNNVNVSIGYDERCVVFVKAINSNNLAAKDWSLGSGFYTNDLTYNSSNEDNGMTMEEFYITRVSDYGEVIKDLVKKKTPNSLAGIPNSPILNNDNFKVVQINKHLTDNPDANNIKQKHNSQLTLKSEIKNIENALFEINKRQGLKINNDAQVQQMSLDIKKLNDSKLNKSKLLASLTTEIIDLSKSPLTKIEPKFRIRGFWDFPEAVQTRGTKPQEIIQFVVNYRYLSKDGSQGAVEVFETNGKTAVYSEWVSFKTDVRKRVYDDKTGEYHWEIEDTESADTPNINQLDIPIQINEIVEIRIKSISEVGYPESPVESEWSEILTVEFPSELENVLNDTDFILREATSDESRVAFKNELSSLGYDEHMSDMTIINGKRIFHKASNISSEKKDANGIFMDMLEYMTSLENRIKSLEDKIKRAKGELQVVIYRNNQEFIVSNGSETVFNVECEDYLIKYNGDDAPSAGGRVYSNDIYVIKDFVVKVRNASVDTPLGLLSDKIYQQNETVYTGGAPQVFFVNEQDELITLDTSGSSKTQTNNQFIWQVNYDKIELNDTTSSNNTVIKLADDIGNNFGVAGNNSLINVLSSSEYNLGYSSINILNFNSNNKSLLDASKWTDNNPSISSTSKLLTTIHPVVPSLENITEKNSDKVKVLNSGDNNAMIVPINIYFKMNTMDNTQSGNNHNYVDLNNMKTTVRHIKKVKFMLENESDNRPFVFSIKFNINRNKTIIKKTAVNFNAQNK